MNNRTTAYFKNGALYKIRPLNFKKLYDDRERAYNARYIVSDKKRYDLQNIESIKSIAIPKYKADAPIGVTGYLEYVLYKHISTGNDDLDLEILSKYTVLLKHSCFVYGDKEWYRWPKKLYDLGMFEKGDKALEIIKNYRPKPQENALSRGNLRDMVERNRKIYNSDLIEIQASYTRCEKCAIYANRIYSVNGEDYRFPKCPEWIIEKGSVCDKGCGSAIFPIFYSEDITTISTYIDNKRGLPSRVEMEPISYSGRPFVDTRNEAELERYYKLQAQREDAQIKSAYYMTNYRNYCYGKINNPKKSPKSFSAYMRKLSKEGKYF